MPHRARAGETSVERAVLEVAEVRALAEATGSVEERAVFLTVYDLALRASELAPLKVSDVDVVGRTIRTRPTKRGQDNLTVISQTTASALRDYLAGRSDSDPLLFPGWKRPRRFENFFRALVERVGLPSYPGKRSADKRTVAKDPRDKGFSHILRRSRATHLLDEGVELKQVQRQLRHRSWETTMLYAGLSLKRRREVDRIAADLMDSW